ncbi:terminase large subunit [Weissella paramesenteroides]|uniref:terminase TerL endonuclease subunit n=1 Tax=Weissella paramesenteroides TaxID=1249 RepID=UPI0038579C48
MIPVVKIDLTKKGVTLEKVYHEADYDDVFKKYRDPATTYARKVLSGEILAGYKIRLAMFRHVRDLKRAEKGETDFPFHYDLDQVKMILAFAMICPDVDTGKPLPLMGWQQMILALTVGWRRVDNQKRFNRVLLSIARTNGKTYIVNILMLYAYLVEGDGQFNQDYLYSSITSEQTNKGWNYIMLTANRLKASEYFKSKFVNDDIVVQEMSIRSKKNRSKIIKMSNLAGQVDSFHIRLGVEDESGDSRKDESVTGKITSGMMQVTNHQLIQISTAYNDANVKFRTDQLAMTENIEKDYLRERDDFLLLVWEQDSLKEIEQPETWIKSNPILGLADKHDSMLLSMKSERDNKMADGTIQDFYTRNMNFWTVDKTKKFLDIDDIEGAVTNEPFDMDGRDVYVGFDYSIANDNTSLVFNFPYEADDGTHMHYLYQHSFVPTAAVNGNISLKEKQDGIPYRKAEKLGYASISQLATGDVDLDDVYDWLMHFIDDHQLNVIFFIYDKYRVNKLIQQLDTNTDMPLVPLAQDFLHISEPTAATRKVFTQKRVKYADDPIMQASLFHAILREDNNSVAVDKKKATLKIDVVDAIIDSMNEAVLHWENFNGHTEKVPKSVFGNQSNEQVSAWFKDSFSF